MSTTPPPGTSVGPSTPIEDEKTPKSRIASMMSVNSGASGETSASKKQIKKESTSSSPAAAAGGGAGGATSSTPNTVVVVTSNSLPPSPPPTHNKVKKKKLTPFLYIVPPTPSPSPPPLSASPSPTSSPKKASLISKLLQGWWLDSDGKAVKWRTDTKSEKKNVKGWVRNIGDKNKSRVGIAMDVQAKTKKGVDKLVRDMPGKAEPWIVERGKLPVAWWNRER